MSSSIDNLINEVNNLSHEQRQIFYNTLNKKYNTQTIFEEKIKTKTKVEKEKNVNIIHSKLFYTTIGTIGGGCFGLVLGGPPLAFLFSSIGYWQGSLK